MHRALADALADGRSVFVLHRHADADCVGAAAALARAFGGPLWAPAGVSAPGRRVASAASVALAEGPLPSAARYVLVDTSAWSQVGEAASALRALPHLVVDHHAYGDDFAEASLALRDPAKSSTCEIVLDVLDAARRPPDATSALALLSGLVADSGRFRWGGAATLRAAARLVDAGPTPEDALRLLEEEDVEDRSARIARLRAARRARLFAAGDLLVATSRVGSHEGAAAGGLVRLGADVALVATPTREDGREGARVSARAATGTPVHLGEVLNALARRHPGAGGGGHEASAGLRADGDPDAWLARALGAVAESLGAGLEEITEREAGP